MLQITIIFESLNSKFFLFMKILAFAASNHSKSINKKLIEYTCSLIHGHDINIIDINDFEMPIYSTDRQVESGVPDLAIQLASSIDDSDLIIISFAEHNGSYTTAFKNIFDWLSVIKDRKTWGDKNMLLMATSPGPRGGHAVLETAVHRFPFNGGKVVASYSLPSFSSNYSDAVGITNEEHKSRLIEIINSIS